MVAPAGLVTVAEYLASSEKPGREYLDGVLKVKPRPTWKHGLIQAFLAMLIFRNSQLKAASEVTVKVREGRYFVPDLIVQAGEIQGPYPTEPVSLCVEILSPEDRLGEVLTKAEAYHDWGVAMVWIIDPERRRAWNYERGGALREASVEGGLQADGLEISVRELFSVLD
jgi:Uma2 family endonuclease